MYIPFRGLNYFSCFSMCLSINRLKFPFILLFNYRKFIFEPKFIFQPKIEKVDTEEDSEMVDASTVVKFASLVKRIAAAARPVYTQPSNVKNFKKFNKVP